MQRSGIRWAFLLGITTLVGFLTLTPAPADGMSIPFLCITCGAWVQDGLNNILMFAPFGLACAMLGLRPLRVIAAALGYSFAIELLQYAVVTGRDASAADLLSNTLGGALGALTWRWSLWWPAPAVARRLVLPAAVAAGAIFGVAGLWFVPGAPQGPYYPSLDPANGPFPAPARLLEATWNGRRLQCCPDPGWPVLRREVSRADVTIRVRAQLLDTPRTTGRLLTVWDNASKAVAVVGIDRTGVWGTFATRGQTGGGRAFAVHAPSAQPWNTGDTVEVTLRTARGAWAIDLTHRGQHASRILRQGPVLSSLYFLPGFAMVHDPLPFWRWLLALLPASVVALWSARTMHRASPSLAVTLLLGTGALLGAPWQHPAALWQFSAAVLLTFTAVTWSVRWRSTRDAHARPREVGQPASS